MSKPGFYCQIKIKCYDIIAKNVISASRLCDKLFMFVCSINP